MRARPRASLKARAIGLLAQREHSRSELRGKLLRHLQAEARALEGADTEPDAGAAQVEALLDELVAQGHLSEARFTASRLRVRAARYGTERIRQELSRHGIAMPTDERRALEGSEYERAREVWQRKFGQPAADAAGRAKQARFLAARGFAGEVIRRIVLGPHED